MTDDGALLLRAIITNPADDIARLVYADYLDGLPISRMTCSMCDDVKKSDKFMRAVGWYKGKSTPSPVVTTCPACNADLAAFIRLQVEHSHLPTALNLCHIPDGSRPRPYDVESLPYHCLPRCSLCRSIKLSELIPKLLSRHEFIWAAPLGDIGFQANSTWVPECEWVFTRGFVSEITLSCADFMDEARTASIFARHPITSVKLADRVPAHGGTQTQYRYGWFRNRLPGWADTAEQGNADLIPYPIWDLLPEQPSKDWRMYDTSELAHAALALASANYGRQLTGLPLLTTLPTGV